MEEDTYKYTPLPAPIQTTDLVNCPAWEEACAKYGYNPLEFLHYSQPAVDREALAEQEAAFEYEMELRRQEYEMELRRLVAIIAYDPQRVAKAITHDDDGCKEWCCANPVS